MKAHLIDTHLLVPRSRSSAKVKVKFQGHVSQKMGVLGALVFHKHILFSMKFYIIFFCICNGACIFSSNGIYGIYKVKPSCAQRNLFPNNMCILCSFIGYIQVLQILLTVDT